MEQYMEQNPVYCSITTTYYDDSSNSEESPRAWRSRILLFLISLGGWDRGLQGWGKSSQPASTHSCSPRMSDKWWAIFEMLELKKKILSYESHGQPIMWWEGKDRIPLPWACTCVGKVLGPLALILILEAKLEALPGGTCHPNEYQAAN